MIRLIMWCLGFSLVETNSQTVTTQQQTNTAVRTFTSIEELAKVFEAELSKNNFDDQAAWGKIAQSYGWDKSELETKKFELQQYYAKQEVSKNQAKSNGVLETQQPKTREL